MKESLRSNPVVDLAKYREKAAQKPQQQLPPPIPQDVLDTIMYHLLMAGRAIAAHTNQ